MALLFFDGFEGLRANAVGSQTLALRRFDEVNGNVGNVDARLATSVDPNNPNGLWGGCTGGESSNLLMYGKYISATTEVFVGCRYLYGSLTDNLTTATAEYRVIQLRDDAGTEQITVTFVPATGTFRVRRGGTAGTQLAVSSTGIYPGKLWKYLELQVVGNNTTGSVDLRLQGVSIASATNVDTLNGGNENYTRVYWCYGRNADTVGFDDVYICDATGSAPYNTFLGDVRVLELLPSAAGDSTQWTPNAGANWDRVDDANRDDGDTTFVSDSTAGDADLYNLTNPSSSATIVRAIKAVTTARKADAGAQNIELLIKSGSTTDDAGPFALIDSYREYTETWLQNPDTSADWTIADLDALQSGFRIPV